MKKLMIFILLLGLTQFTYSQNGFDDFKNISNENLMDSLREHVESMGKGEFCKMRKYSEKILTHINNCGNDLNKVMNTFDFNDPKQKEKITLYKDFVHYLSKSYYQSQEIVKNSNALCSKDSSSLEGSKEKIRTNYSLLRDNIILLNESLEKIEYFLDNEYEVKYRILEVRANCPSPDIQISFKNELNLKNEWELIESYYTPIGERSGGANVKFKIKKPGYYKIVASPDSDWELKEATGIVLIGFEKKNIIKKTLSCH